MFKPNEAQRQAKSTFWLCYEGDGPVDTELALQYSGDSRVASWWSERGFQEWFIHRKELDQTIESASFEAVDTIRQIMRTSDDAKVRLAAARAMLELGKKFPAKAVDTPDKFLDDAITKMNKEQLRAYLQRTAPKLLQAPVVTIEATVTDKE